MFTPKLTRRLLTRLGRGCFRRSQRRVATSARLTPTAQRLEDRWLLSATSSFDLLDQADESGDGQSDQPVSIHFSAEVGRLTVCAIMGTHIEILESEGQVQVLVDGEILKHDDVSANTVKSIAVTGSGGPDLIDLRAVTSSSFPNVNEVSVAGGAGMDTIYGSQFGDGIHAGDDHDFVFGGLGNDTIEGGRGGDTLVGDDGDDFISGGSGDDLLNGRNGDDTLHGGVGDDRLFGGSGRDSLVGDEGNDVLKGQAGRDTLHVENGDLVKGNTSLDQLYMDDSQPTPTLDGADTTSNNLTTTHADHLDNEDQAFALLCDWVDMI